MLKNNNPIEEAKLTGTSELPPFKAFINCSEDEKLSYVDFSVMEFSWAVDYWAGGDHGN